MAQQDDGVRRDPGDQLMREQMERAREQLLRQETPRVDVPALDGGIDRDPASIAEDGPAFRIDRFERQGAFPLAEDEFERLVAPFRGIDLGRQRIGELINRLNRAMVAAGFITSRAYVGAQNLSSGVLTLVFVAGRIEAIRYNGADLASAGLGVRMALPMRPGDVLQLRDIEQGVDQLNRLPTNRASVRILPGETAGGSIVDITNEVGASRVRYVLAADNQGSSATGVSRLRATAEAGDLIGLMESLAVGFTGSNDTNALYVSWSLPYGYNTFSLLSSWSEYQSLMGDIALVYGTSRSNALSWNRLIHRDRSSKTAVDASLSTRYAQRHINNVELTPQRLTVLRIGANRLTRFPVGQRLGQWTVAAGLGQGLPWLGADRDADHLPDEAARAQFSKLDAAVSLSMPIGNDWLGRANVAAQWSRVPLFSSEQIFVGGVSSVRGLPESATGGDRGAWLRTELAYARRFAWFEGRFAVEPYIFADGGRAQTIADHRWQGAASIGAGARFAWTGGMAELIAGFPLAHPDAIDGSPRLHANLALSF